MKDTTELIIGAANRVACSLPIARRVLRDSIVVFLYHEVSDYPSPFNKMFDLNVRPAVFSRQLDLISQYFYVINPNELISGEYATPAALITFDDGNLSYFREALPILRNKGIPSLMFLNAGPIKGEVCWSGLVTFLGYLEANFCKQRRRRGEDFFKFTEAEVSSYLASVERDPLLERVRSFRGAVAREGDVEAVFRESLVYLGNHLYNHYNATTLSQDRLKEEYWKNQQILDVHPRGTKLFSYPFGQPVTCYNEETTRIILGEGAHAIFSAYPLPNFGRGGVFYNRVPLTEAMHSEKDLYHSIMTNYFRARLRLLPDASVWI